jgi:hypothetical protein
LHYVTAAILFDLTTIRIDLRDVNSNFAGNIATLFVACDKLRYEDYGGSPIVAIMGHACLASHDLSLRESGFDHRITDAEAREI